MAILCNRGFCCAALGGTENDDGCGYFAPHGFSNRVIDWHDVRGIIVRQGLGNLDWNYINKELAPLCEAKEQPEIVGRLQLLRQELAAF